MSSDPNDPLRPPTPPVQLDYRARPTRHKPIAFVPPQPDRAAPSARESIGSSYLALVLPPAAASPAPISAADTVLATESCAVCRLPVAHADAKAHHTSTAHQACLQHTHVPSAVDRARKGLRFLQAYGWDPDARVGLGAGRSLSRLHPVKPEEKVGRGGIGAPPVRQRKTPDVVKKTGPKEIRKAETSQRRRNEKLQRMFYSNDDVEKYLGLDA